MSCSNRQGEWPGKEEAPELNSEDDFWHELVLCGVGGKTVAEAKASMTWSEYLAWCQFRAKYGPLHVGMRVDRAVARAIANYFSANSKRRYSVLDFSPFDKAIEDSKPVEQKIDEALSHFPRA